MEWYPKYPLKYGAKTAHLTLAEHGAYNLLIDWYMVHEEPLPDDNGALARILGCDVDEWIRMSAKLRAFFVADDGRLKHKRCEHELDEQSHRKKSWAKTKRKQRAAKRLKQQQTVLIDSPPCPPDVLSDSTVQDIRKREPEIPPVDNSPKLSALLSKVANKLSEKPVNGTRANYDDRDVRKQRWQQKIISEIHKTTPTQRAQNIIDAYGRGEQWAKDEFERVDQYIKQRNAVAGGIER